MNDAASVRVRESARDVFEDAYRLTYRERTARHSRAHGLSVHVRHDEVRELIGLTCAEHRHDMRVLQCGRKHDLTLESIDGDTGRQIVRQHLDDNLSPERVSVATKTSTCRRHRAPAQWCRRSRVPAAGLRECLPLNRSSRNASLRIQSVLLYRQRSRRKGFVTVADRTLPSHGALLPYILGEDVELHSQTWTTDATRRSLRTREYQ